ncbi:MAG: helix-turn-helix domain-containing protein [Chloroflexi bacterium]|nr:helix-turn-helix domain-containing protein [Chloroflexota bacterium]
MHTEEEARVPVSQSLPDYLSRKEVAALLHVSTATVARWARARRLPYVRTLGGHRRYPCDAIMRLAEQLMLTAGEPSQEHHHQWPR